MRGGLFCLIAYSQMGGPISKQSIDPIMPMVSLREALTALERCGSFTLPESMSSEKGWKLIRRSLWRESVKRNATEFAAALGLTEADEFALTNEEIANAKRIARNKESKEAAAAAAAVRDAEVASLTSAASGEFTQSQATRTAH